MVVTTALKWAIWYSIRIMEQTLEADMSDLRWETEESIQAIYWEAISRIR